MAEEDLPNPSGLLIYFLVISIIYLIYTAIQLFTSSSETNIQTLSEKANNMNLNIAYILVLIIGTYFININISKAMCSSQQIDWLNILFITLLPWLIIFIVLYFLLEIFPGWVTPFSNTLGYLVVSLLGVETKLKIMLNEYKDDTDKKDKELVKAIANIQSNKSKFINQFNEKPYEFSEFIIKLGNAKIIKDNYTLTPDNYEGKKELADIYKLVLLKHIIGKLFWYILAGVLISSITYSFIINLTCNKSIEEAERDHEEFLYSTN